MAGEALGSGNKARKRAFEERSTMGSSRCQTGHELSFWATYFGAKDDPNLFTMGTRVTRWTENKALVSIGTNPKVTGRIGPASANIMLDCVIK
jgi:hypothetical protein